MCTKFRLFCLTLFAGISNILLYRIYFQFRTSELSILSSVTYNGVHTLANATSVVTHDSVNSSYPKFVTIPAAKNVTKTSGVHGYGRVLEACGKLVTPLANAAVPWSHGNATTLCPLVPPKLVGRLATHTTAPNWTDVLSMNPKLEIGGHYQPTECQARHRVVIIVPYRDREEHLRLLLHNLYPILIRQQLDYFILVVELAQPTKFNRAMLLNIGAVEALGLWDVQCFIFHDVDLVPEDDRNLYTCPEMPRHMSAAIDKFNYKFV